MLVDSLSTSYTYSYFLFVMLWVVQSTAKQSGHTCLSADMPNNKGTTMCLHIPSHKFSHSISDLSLVYYCFQVPLNATRVLVSGYSTTVEIYYCGRCMFYGKLPYFSFCVPFVLQAVHVFNITLSQVTGYDTQQLKQGHFHGPFVNSNTPSYSIIPPVQF